MRLFDFFKKKQPSASVAKERLQILVSHERATRGAPSWLGDLKNDILEVVKKYVEVEPDAISFKVGREENRELLELNIALPGGAAQVKAALKTEKADDAKESSSKPEKTDDAKGASSKPAKAAKDAPGGKKSAATSE